LGFLALAGLATVYMAGRAADAEREVAHTLEVKEAVTRLLCYVEESQSAERGFLLTANEEHVAAFNRAKGAIPATFGELAQLTSGSPEENELLSSLEAIINSMLGLSEGTVALAKQGRTGEAAALIKADRGKELTDLLKAQVNMFSGRESDLLAEQQAVSAAYRLWLLVLICSSLAAASGFAAVLANETKLAIGNLRERSAELEAEVKLRRETQASLHQAQKMEAVGQLTGGIAHDFNNLLTIILGNLDTLRRHLSSVPPAQSGKELASMLSKPLGTAMGGARRASELTHRLLAFARQQPLEPVKLDLNHLVLEMSDLLRRTLGETITTETVLSGGLWLCFADANQLENALLNLCINARDAMPEGGHLTIETANAYLDDAYAGQFVDVRPGQYVLLSVADTGTGIAADVLPRIFEPFFTTKRPGNGTGLGLAMVYGFVKQSGGHIRVYSEAGQGTTVKIYLPRLAETRQKGAAPAALPEFSSEAPPAVPQETVLVVEDNPDVRRYARSVLAELGYEVIEAGAAAEALRVLESARRVDLLFTDVILPDTDGRELSNQALKIRPNLPVLFTTGYSRNAIIHQGRLDPGVQLLSKPYTRQDLARKVRELLDARAALSQPA
jgi:signal transduction histidine kinase/CheY-like chemotaxis protein